MIVIKQIYKSGETQVNEVTDLAEFLNLMINIDERLIEVSFEGLPPYRVLYSQGIHEEVNFYHYRRIYDQWFPEKFCNSGI